MSNNVITKKYPALKSAAMALIAIAISLVSCTPETGTDPDTVIPDFSVEGYNPNAANIVIYEGDSILFINESSDNAQFFSWDFYGGVPSFFNGENPPYIVYPTAGNYEVRIRASADGTNYVNKSRYLYIIVLADTNSTTGCGTEVTDIDGNVYNVVEIGSQCWMQQNLKTATYNDGTPIPTGLNDAAWSTDNAGAYTLYNNDNMNDNYHGKLYNFFAVNTGKLCPQGWHIPTQNDFLELVNTIGGEAQGGTLKHTLWWDAPNTGATNSSGFTALGSGYRVNDGSYYGMRTHGLFWSSTPTNDGGAYHMYLLNDQENVYVEGFPAENGFSCRCVKD